MSSASDPDLMIGVGQDERQDDGVGPMIARELDRRGLPAVVHAGDGTGLLDLWSGRRAVLVVDAMSGPAPPGEIRLFSDLDDAAFRRAAFVHSTHRLGLPEAVALGRALGRLPQRLLVIGIAGAAFDFGRDLSPPVAAAAGRVVATLAAADGAVDAEALAGLASAPARSGAG